MSTNSLMHLGVQAMFAAQTQMNTTGHNIVNSAVEGYSRQTVKLATVAGRSTGVGYIGGGVAVESVDRAVNQFLTSQSQRSQSIAKADSTRAGMLGQLESAHLLGESGLGQAASRLFTAFGDMAASPKDEAVREVVLSAVDTTASRFRTTGERLATLQTATAQQLRDEVTVVNGLTGQIADLNRQLAGTSGTSKQPNDLLDQRDALIAQLGEHIDVSRVDTRGHDGKPDGSVSLFVGGGQALVLGTDVHALKAISDDTVPGQVRIAVSVNGHDRELPTDSLQGGAIAGLLQFQDDDLRKARTELGMLAAGLADAVNTQHARGTDLDGVAGQPLLQVGAPTASASSRNARDSDGEWLAEVTVRRVAGQGEQLRASDYTLELDPRDSSKYQLTRHSDGTVFGGLDNGAQVDGFTFAVGATPMGQQDKFLLQPVSGAADAAALAITDGRKLAAAGASAAGSGNTNALSLQNLAKASLVEGNTFQNAHARVISALGVRVQRANSESTSSTQAAAQAKAQLGSETGVNLEEEAARLLQFQQSYQAAAKVLVTAQKMFDTMLSVMN